MNSKKIYLLLAAALFSEVSAQIPTSREYYEVVPNKPPDPVYKLNGEYTFSADKKKKGLKIKEKVILEPVYDEISIYHSYPEKILKVKKDNKYGFFSLNGQNLIPVNFENIESSDNRFFVAKKEKNISIFDLEKKKTVISGNYSNLIIYNQKSALVEDESGAQIIVFEGGKKIKNDFESLEFYPNVLVVKKNGKQAILTEKGNPNYEFDQLFFPSLKGSKLGNHVKYSLMIKDFVAVKNKMYGLVDITGKTKLPFEYNNISRDERIEGFRLEKNKKIGQYFDENKILKTEYTTIYRDGLSDYLTLGKDGKFSVVNYATLKTIIPFIADEHMIRMGNGYTVTQNRKSGWYDREGNQILPPEYDEISNYYDADQLLRLVKNGKKGIYDLRKKQNIVPTEFDEITDYFTGFLVGINENRVNNQTTTREYTLMDLNGKKLLNEKFNSFEKSPVKNSQVLFAEKKDGYSILTSKGAVSLENITSYDYIFDENQLISPDSQNENALIAVKNKQNKWAIYDEKQEKLKSDFSYDEIKQKFENENTYLIVSKNKKYGIIDQNNKTIVNFNYDHLSFDLLNTYKDDKQTVVAKKNGKYGLIDFSGKEVIPFSYADLQRISGDDLFKAKLGKNYILINSQNTVLNKGPFDDISNFEDEKALSFSGQKVREIDSKGQFAKFEDQFSIHQGFKTFDEMKYGFLKMLDSKTDAEVKEYARKIAPSPHLIYFLRESSFKNRVAYLDSESIVNVYYSELLNLKNNNRNRTYLHEKLSSVKDFTGYNDGMTTSYRTGIQDYGDSIAEKFLRNSFKINGYWISSRFLYY